jgi:hypothetical protein
MKHIGGRLMNMNERNNSYYINKHIIIGLTFINYEGEIVKQSQLHGDITRITESAILIKLSGSGEEYSLPPDIEAISEATPGEYRFKSTGEVIVNPDFMASWTIHEPKPEEL